MAIVDKISIEEVTEIDVVIGNSNVRVLVDGWGVSKFISEKRKLFK